MDFRALLENIKSKNVLCIGDLILDVFIYGDAERLSPEAPIPILRKNHTRHALGGVGNVAANIASLGGRCHLIAPIGAETGKNSGAEIIKEIVAEKSLASHSLIACGDRPTSEKQRYIANYQQILRVDWEQTRDIDVATQEQILTFAVDVLAEADAMVLSDYGKGALPKVLIRELIALANRQEVLVFVDPKGEDYSKYRGANYVTPNRRELSLATRLATDSDDEVVDACRRIIADCGLQAVLATRSEQGMSLILADSEAHFPTHAVDIFDVAGAGDTVIAAFALACAGGVAIEAAVDFANMAAGVVVEKAEVATVTPQEIHTRILEQGFHASHAAAVNKRVDLLQALALLGEWRDKGASIGFTNGCFDIVHAGHLSLLKQAAGQVDKLIVGLNSDASVRRLKGEGRPVQNEQDRVALLSHLAVVDLIVVFDEDTPYALIEALSPDVLIKGKDYVEAEIVGGDFVRKSGGRIFLADLKAGLSSTAIIDRITMGR